MELRHLRHFLAVMDHRSYGRAATAVNLTQQALSHSILTLERELQVKLFERGPFGAEPTPAGRLFERRARLICAESDFASAEMSSYRGGGEGHVRIGVSQNFATRLAPQALLLFQAAKPHVRASFVVGTSGRILDLAVSGQVDFAVTSPLSGVDGYPELRHETIGERYLHDPSFVVMRQAHPLAARPSLTFADLGSYAWCMPESFAFLWESVFRAIQEAGGAPPGYAVMSDSLSFAKSLLLQSDFISMLGAEVVRFELQAGLLVARHLPPMLKPAAGYVSYRRRSQLQPAAATMLNCFERAMQDIELTPAPAPVSAPG
jgi:DNA-binding transcriptional LysR family regulator